jgi:methionyl-tRNA synthetase
MDKSKTFYITTPIYYVNDTPHIGHAYTTILADVLTRFHKLAGDATFLLTGTDEHGQKVQQAADKRGVTPQEHCDLYSVRFREAWGQLNIGFDKFIRTTDPEHVRYVRGVLRKLWDKGQIYEKEYEGWYSVGEERFFAENELVDGKDPISGRPVEKIREKNYFFKMSAYREWLIKYIEENPDFIVPEFRRNEVLGFLRQPLNDLCISRPKSRLAWGITLPFDEAYVAYVWVDALFNYQSGVDGKAFPDGSAMWPADYHLLGKDILTTHAVYWTTMLKALDAPMPRHILAHGWWLFDNARMSKTTGNVVNPLAMKDVYGVDAFRYFLIREMVVGQDASFSEEALVNRLNSDLANDVGNGLSRILKLAATGLDGRLTPVHSPDGEEAALKRTAEETIVTALDKVRGLKLSFAIEDVLQLIRSVNRYLEVKAPWKLAKEGPEGRDRLNIVLYHAAEALRIGFQLLHPVMPAKMEEALAALGIPFSAEAVGSSSTLAWGAWKADQPLLQGVNLFPRIDVSARNKENEAKGATAKNAAAKNDPSADPFSLVHLKVARVKEVADHPNADSLYVLSLLFGEGEGAEERTVCAGLKKHLGKDELRGKDVVVVYNLKPANLRGVESKGMILAAEGEGGKLAPVLPDQGKPGDDVTAEGLVSAPKTDLTLKEFEKAPLTVKSGRVCYGDRPLQSPHGAVLAAAAEGSTVR